MEYSPGSSPFCKQPVTVTLFPLFVFVWVSCAVHASEPKPKARTHATAYLAQVVGSFISAPLRLKYGPGNLLLPSRISIQLEMGSYTTMRATGLPSSSCSGVYTR